ncbi:hypothetical protein [Paenibacillus polymyxa]|uniref:hypothetical protein n=1 Tax=Paenibacillus polymyxa TaxID=1406 RepID=UPI001868EF96|nr:hypothetical protein [Paenibacillus polymyxa]
MKMLWLKDTYYIRGPLSSKGYITDLEKVFEYLNNPYFRADWVDYHLRRLINEGLLPSYVSRQTDKLDLQLLLLARLTGNEKNIK